MLEKSEGEKKLIAAAASVSGRSRPSKMMNASCVVDNDTIDR